MNSNNCILKIEIFYKDTKCEISSKNKITLEDMQNKSIEDFKITKENKNFLRFCHKDKEKKIKFLENDDDIMKNVEEVGPNNYLLKTELIFDKYKYKYELYKIVSRDKIDSLQTEYKILKKENKDLDNKIKNNENIINQLKADNDNLNKKIIETENILKEQIDTLKSENEKLKKEINNIKNKNLLKSFNENEERYNKLKEENNNLNKIINEYKNKYEELEKKNSILQGTIEKMNQSLININEGIDSQKNDINNNLKTFIDTTIENKLLEIDKKNKKYLNKVEQQNILENQHIILKEILEIKQKLSDNLGVTKKKDINNNNNSNDKNNVNKKKLQAIENQQKDKNEEKLNEKNDDTYKEYSEDIWIPKKSKEISDKDNDNTNQQYKDPHNTHIDAIEYNDGNINKNEKRKVHKKNRNEMKKDIKGNINNIYSLFNEEENNNDNKVINKCINSNNNNNKNEESNLNEKRDKDNDMINKFKEEYNLEGKYSDEKILAALKKNEGDFSKAIIELSLQ